MIRKVALLLIALLAVPVLWAQQKYALVIGNGNYTGISRLTNPVNDANDMETTLRSLGFTVEKVTNGSLDQMENAVIRLKNRLSVAKDSYGFLFYAGHGVQSGGVNYLIPVDANIPSESFLRNRAVAVQAMMDELNDAGNALNIVVLDACRDNPFSWARSGSRGLTVLSNQPADSIIVYATSAGSTAADGVGRNGLFTGHLLDNLKTPGLEVSEIFRLTGAAVSQASDRQQIPAVYNQFFGTAYLNPRPAPAPPPPPPPAPSISASAALGNITISSDIAGEILIDGRAIGTSIREGGTVTINNLETGATEAAVRGTDGTVTRAPAVRVLPGQTVSVAITRPAPTPAPQPTPAARPAPAVITPAPAPVIQWGPVINPNNVWRTYTRDGGTASFNVAKEFIDGKERDVLNIAINFPSRRLPDAHANVYTTNSSVIWLFQAGSRLRFKAIGDGKRWRLTFLTPDKTATTPNTGYCVTIATRKNRVVDIDIPYTKFAYNWGVRGRLDKSKITTFEFARVWDDRTSSTLKVFDFEIVP